MYISICIPAFRRVEFLKRLLDSIARQQFRDFEVIVTDDSPDESVQQLCIEYSGKFDLKYFRNAATLGTPENWNESMRRASGQWIKLLHDDDWLAHESSLQHFADATNQYPTTDFFFCAYCNVDLENGSTNEVMMDSSRYRSVLKNPLLLSAHNDIGHPSVTLHRNDQRFFYDNKVKWVVDVDFYIRYFSSSKPVFIPRVLVNIGMGGHQVTRDTFRVRKVEIVENFYLLNKMGVKALKNWRIYDHWWRLFRNLQITTFNEIRETGYDGRIEPAIVSMLNWQRNIPRVVLTKGIFSKIFMFLHYWLHRQTIGSISHQ